MPEVDSNRSQKDFILSIRGLYDSWAATQLQELVKKDHQGEQYTSTTDLDNEQETNEALRNADDVEHRQSEAEQAEEQLLGEAVGHQQLDKESTARWLPTPESTPEPNEQSVSSQENELPRGWQAIAPDADAPDRRSNSAPRREETSSQIDASNVLMSRRQRRTLGPYYTAFAVAVNSSGLRSCSAKSQAHDYTGTSSHHLHDIGDA
ncbi:uncharacterized protein M421DRAFT_6197 [Didymella exigua CBS 183.55]|uniref:Uncharacterized protein n=1 Tax=Didymella exigua CBS 183.55 TaxID=1150837 RepID=A0A6A5RGI2_9PLEO|nr:uncharacterized protein M421DRAFT_6197 [Didymella exigua CBS 183.55]KAF1927421.1 hypothetical protein M421DRAFT_6197 [Didymella exigua CBS 183.55]